MLRIIRLRRRPDAKQYVQNIIFYNYVFILLINQFIYLSIYYIMYLKLLPSYFRILNFLVKKVTKVSYSSLKLLTVDLCVTLLIGDCL